MSRPYSTRRDGDAALYRFFSATGELLYIGAMLAINISGRMRHHKCTKPWITETKNISLEWYPNKEDAFAAESAAIAIENPKYNTRKRPVDCEKHGVPLHPKKGKRRDWFCPVCMSEYHAKRYREKVGRPLFGPNTGKGKYQRRAAAVTAC